MHLAAALRLGAPLPAPLPPRPPQPTCGGSKTTATPSARGEGREVLTLGRCRRAGFAGGGWERARGGTEPGGGSPALPPRAARAAPRRAGGGGGAGRGEGWSAAGVGQRCRPGSAPAWRPARRDRRLLRPVLGWFLCLCSARRASGALPPERKGAGGERRCQLASTRPPSPEAAIPSLPHPCHPCLPSLASGTARGRCVCVTRPAPPPGSARRGRGRAARGGRSRRGDAECGVRRGAGSVPGLRLLLEIAFSGAHCTRPL